ncbi:MAG TPA: sodium:proton antiporter [Arenibaculum sp.]|nr:sodium:proton antiporter [Arenibaculum sp.]
MDTDILTVVLSIAVAGVAAQWFAWRTGLPAIVILLVVGILVGPVFGLIDPSVESGTALASVVGLVVGIIVFEGGLNLNLRELRAAGSGVLRLTVLALPLSWLFGTLAGHWIGGLSWPVATLFGAILVVTGPTVILPLLRQAKLQRRPASFLKWEGIVNDPIGALLAILILEFLIQTGGRGADTPEDAAVELGGHLALGTLVAIVLGIGLPFAIRWVFRRDQAPEMLKTPILLASVLAIYAASNAVQHEAGLVGATLFGLVLANIGITGIQELRRFKESLTILLVSALFILLTSALDPQVFERLSWRIVALVAAVLFVVRPAAIMIATIGSHMTLRERLLCAWIAPRGIVAAAVAGIAGTRLVENGFEDGELILPMVFSVIAATVVAHGFTIRWLAQRLDLTVSERPGLLIVGASRWTTRLATLLDRAGVPVVVADTSWSALRPARRSGLATACTELLSERAEEVFELERVDYVLAATDDDAYNALICARFAPELGRERVHQMAMHSGTLDARHLPSREWRGKIVSDRRLDVHAIEGMMGDDWTLSARQIDAAGGGSKVVEARADWKPIVLVRPDGTLAFFSPERPVDVASGGTLIALETSGAERDSAPGRLRQALG